MDNFIFMGCVVSDNKSIKDYCKEAKKRMKSKFWQDYKERVDTSVQEGEKSGIQSSKVVGPLCGRMGV